jgi:hypothetical protein
MWVGVALYLLFRFQDWGSYMKALAIFGVFVPCVWAPVVIKSWFRRWELLCLRWERRNSVYFMLDDLHTKANPEFQVRAKHSH